MKVRLFRDGEELEWVLHDAHFDFNYQQNRLLREEFSLLPGDHITVGEDDFNSPVIMVLLVVKDESRFCIDAY